MTKTEGYLNKIIMVLSKGPKSRLADVAADAGLTYSQAATGVAHNEAREYVQCERYHDGRNRATWSLTPLGVERAKSLGADIGGRSATLAVHGAIEEIKFLDSGCAVTVSFSTIGRVKVSTSVEDAARMAMSGGVSGDLVINRLRPLD